MSHEDWKEQRRKDLAAAFLANAKANSKRPVLEVADEAEEELIETIPNPYAGKIDPRWFTNILPPGMFNRGGLLS